MDDNNPDEPDNDAIIVGLGTRGAITNRRSDPWEIYDVCAEDKGTTVKVEVYTDVYYYNPNIAPTTDSMVLYEFYFDGNPAVEVCQFLSGPNNPAGGTPAVYDRGANVGLPGSWATLDPVNKVVTLEVDTTNPLSNSFLTASTHDVYVETREGECATGYGTMLLPNALNPNDRAPDMGVLAMSMGPSGGGGLGISIPTSIDPNSIRIPAVMPRMPGAVPGAVASVLAPAMGALSGGPVGSGQQAPVGASSVASATGGGTSFQQTLASLGLGTGQGASMTAKPAKPGRISQPGQAEFVRVHFDWGLDVYQSVSTHPPAGAPPTSFGRDLWGWNLTNVDASLNGFHLAQVTWFDDGGQTFVAMNNVTFEIALLQDEGPMDAGAPSDAPQDGFDAAASDADSDNDGPLDRVDNCPFSPNPDQLDLDHDGKGNVCDPDADGDQIPNGLDNCAMVPNGDQAITHYPNPKGIGDACNDDWDDDGIRNTADNCPDVSNAKQLDSNNDKVGDACDPAKLAALMGADSVNSASRLSGDVLGAQPQSQYGLADPHSKDPFALGSTGVYVLAMGLALVVLAAILVVRRGA